MKYVRTRFGRILKLTENGCIKENYGTMYAFLDKELSHHLQNGFEIIKQADTIEELIDLYVLEDRKDKHHYIENEISLLPCIYIYDKENTSVYGEIWVDGELHKVAKLNGKGKLELL